MSEQVISTAAVRDLGSGLVVRQASPADVEGIVAHHAEGFRWPRQTEPNTWFTQWVRELADSSHPSVSAWDTIVVEDTSAHKIVSAATLISQTWTYDGVPFPMGQPEIVSTHPDYRGRGLVGALFDMLHDMSVARGQVMQAIHGIPAFYRRFGYDFALERDRGRVCHSADVPILEEGKTEPYVVRPAALSDLAFVMALYQHAEQRHQVSCVRDGAIWHYDMFGRARNSAACRRFAILQTPAGTPVGYVCHSNRGRNGRYGVHAYELISGCSWVEATPSVLRYLKRIGELYAAGDAKHPEATGFDLVLGSDHPAYHAAPWALGRAFPGYAWYLRLPDLRGFVQLIVPALERRLATSIAAGHTGKLEINTFGAGLRLVLERGRIVAVEDFRHTPNEWGMARFPNQTFLQVLFGMMTIGEIAQSVPDCSASTDEARALVAALFPRGVSNVWVVR